MATIGREVTRPRPETAWTCSSAVRNVPVRSRHISRASARVFICAASSCGWDRDNGREHYKHIDTRRYLILDAKGRSYVRRGGDFVRVNFRKEFRRVVEAVDARNID